MTSGRSTPSAVSDDYPGGMWPTDEMIEKVEFLDGLPDKDEGRTPPTPQPAERQDANATLDGRFTMATSRASAALDEWLAQTEEVLRGDAERDTCQDCEDEAAEHGDAA